MNSTTRLTKAQLVERINDLERELDATYVAQRPSRTQQWPIGVAPRDAAPRREGPSIERRGQCTIKRYPVRGAL